MEAARAGRKRRIASPCQKCGCVIRYTSSNQCVACTIERARKHSDTIRDALRSSEG